MSTEKIRLSKIEKQNKKRKMQSIVDIQIHTHQTKTSRLAADYWLASSLVLKLCQYYQVGMAVTWLLVRVCVGYVVMVSTNEPVQAWCEVLDKQLLFAG